MGQVPGATPTAIRAAQVQVQVRVRVRVRVRVPGATMPAALARVEELQRGDAVAAGRLAHFRPRPAAASDCWTTPSCTMWPPRVPKR